MNEERKKKHFTTHQTIEDREEKLKFSSCWLFFGVERGPRTLALVSTSSIEIWQRKSLIFASFHSLSFDRLFYWTFSLLLFSVAGVFVFCGSAFAFVCQFLVCFLPIRHFPVFIFPFVCMVCCSISCVRWRRISKHFSAQTNANESGCLSFLTHTHFMVGIFKPTCWYRTFLVWQLNGSFIIASLI